MVKPTMSRLRCPTSKITKTAQDFSMTVKAKIYVDTQLSYPCNACIKQARKEAEKEIIDCRVDENNFTVKTIQPSGYCEKFDIYSAIPGDIYNFR